MDKHVSVLFVIPVMVEIAGQRFEVYTLVSKIHENVDVVLGIKNVFELEGIFNLQECCFSFESIITNISKRENDNEPRRANGSKDRSTIHR